ncbi:unnamed protein product [Aphanomyces euteiches]|uniref:Uncharacterized protein n=1 Tax=Aphanomyces euteiches TaxID=100861 RepID=A0A6G0X8F0_9STRA|nr:hypothetical protein Ae201684_007375 [Aphanomyces euteiches]KAH9100838.1 hypothetical protein Ae201684P_007030 [Aphanomyces euteiches]KAH9154689.1 hypothetical protein AeRB84_003259 [Aphanomyces euteiches]
MEKQLVARLEQAWSSSDVGAFLDVAKLNELMAVFGDMEPTAKVRLLMALQTAQQEQLKQHRERNNSPTTTSSAGLPDHLLKQILDTADEDNDEWVKIGSGLVRRMLFAATPKEDFLANSIRTTIDQVINLVESRGGGELLVDDWFAQDLAYMTYPKIPFSHSATNDHFTILEEEKKPEDVKSHAVQTPARPPTAIPRRPSSSVSLPPKQPPSAFGVKRSLTDMGSEIRRQAENGRFKRNRSRISVIDIDEVKQIEAEKVQKAEERKLQARRNSSTKAAASNEKEGDTAAPADQAATTTTNTTAPDDADYHQAAAQAMAMVAADASASLQSNYMDYGGMMQYDEAYLQGEDQAAAAAVAAVAAHARLPVFNDSYQYVMDPQQLQAQQALHHHHSQQQQQQQAAPQQSLVFPFDNALYPPQQQQQNQAFPDSYTYNSSMSSGFDSNNSNNYWR